MRVGIAELVILYGVVAVAAVLIIVFVVNKKKK